MPAIAERIAEKVQAVKDHTNGVLSSMQPGFTDEERVISDNPDQTVRLDKQFGYVTIETRKSRFLFNESVVAAGEPRGGKTTLVDGLYEMVDPSENIVRTSVGGKVRETQDVVGFVGQTEQANRDLDKEFRDKLEFAAEGGPLVFGDGHLAGFNAREIPGVVTVFVSAEPEVRHNRLKDSREISYKEAEAANVMRQVGNTRDWRKIYPDLRGKKANPYNPDAIDRKTGKPLYQIVIDTTTSKTPEESRNQVLEDLQKRGVAIRVEQTVFERVKVSPFQYLSLVWEKSVQKRVERSLETKETTRRKLIPAA